MKQSNLEDRKNKEVFKIPEQYFENFESRLMQRINEEPSQSKTRKLNPIYIYFAAASLVIGLCIPYLFNSSSTSAISNEDLESYLEYNITYSVKSDILNELNEEDLSDLEKDFKLNDKDLNEYLLSQTDVEYYLNLNE